jgi:hypothetical protein
MCAQVRILIWFVSSAGVRLGFGFGDEIGRIEIILSSNSN